MKLLRGLRDRFTFTRGEITVILFLSITYGAGLCVRWFQGAGADAGLTFAYQQQDSTFRALSRDADAIARDLRMLAILAIPLGIRIAYKGMSWSRTAKDFSAAGEIVFRANCPNLGLAIDAFDVLASGVALDDLDAIDPGQIFLVQLSDYMWQEGNHPFPCTGEIFPLTGCLLMGDPDLHKLSIGQWRGWSEGKN